MDKKIFLLVDDDLDDTEMFCEALASIDNSIVCHCAGNGQEALQTLNTLYEKPNIIFLDVNMPVMNGWQCLKHLKEDERYKQIPVIIVSTSSHKRESEIAADLGALCYLTKPNDFDELTIVLQVIVANLDDGLSSAL
jgi:CheY-like chemotaxis protein